MELLDTSPESLLRAAALLRAGQVIAYPTETLYGLGADPFNESALDRLFRAKGRDSQRAVLLVVSDQDQLERVVTGVSAKARTYMEAFWPGPLSLLLPAAPGLPDAVAPGGGKVCVRCPGSSVARALCQRFGGPVTSSSANRSGEAPARVLQELNLPGVAVGLDAGPLGSDRPSTIVDVETGEILREGAVSRASLEAAAP